MKCPNCNSDLKDDESKFCESCGFELTLKKENNIPTQENQKNETIKAAKKGMKHRMFPFKKMFKRMGF